MRNALLAGLCFVCLMLLSCQPSPWPQEEKPGKDEKNPIEGDWTKVIRDNGYGQIWCKLPDLSPSKQPSDRWGRWGNRSIRWRITKDAIEEGTEGPVADAAGQRFPEKRYTYKLNPGNQANAIDYGLVEKDLDLVDKAQRGELSAWEKETQRGIYFVKGDYLMICTGEKSRPKNFTANNKAWIANNKDDPTMIDILRRGRSYGRKDKVVIGHKADDSGSPTRKEK